MLFVGDDWARITTMSRSLDSDGRWLGRARLPEGMARMTRLHALIAEHLDDARPRLGHQELVGGIETDRGPWVAALIAAGYQMLAEINPRSVARYRERHATSGRSPTPVMPTCSPRCVRLRPRPSPRSPLTFAKVEGLQTASGAGACARA